jgi:hypothetical protein
MSSKHPDSQRVPQWLYLFTSSIRELYIADAINLLAAPKGALYRFRYEGKYLDNDTREQWDGEGLVDKQVAINFSLQHPAEFHPAMFIPLRTGEVASTEVEGEAYIVYFRLGQYLPLNDQPDWEPKQRKDPVQEYTEGLKKLLGAQHHPDDRIHATLGAPPHGLVSPADDSGKGFAAVVRFLTPCLYFSPRIYWRIAHITEGATGVIVGLDSGGSLSLTAGKEYTVHLAHYQYQAPVAEILLRVEVPKAVDLVGSDKIAILSRYDLMPIRLFPPFRDDVVTGELAISTEAPSKGPDVRLPVIVAPPLQQAFTGPLLAVGGTIALALPAVFASDELLLLRVGLAIGGALIAGIGLWLRRQNGLPG